MGTTAEARPTWLPGNTPPAHLDGVLPGDYGFDPLGFCESPAPPRPAPQSWPFAACVAAVQIHNP